MSSTKLQLLIKEMARMKSKYLLASLKDDKVKIEKIIKMSVLLNRQISNLLNSKDEKCWECKCGETEMNLYMDIERHVCKKCKRRGQWMEVLDDN